MVAAREVPLDPEPEYRVVYVPEVGRDLVGTADFDALITELDATLALRSEHIPGRRVERVEGTSDPVLHRYRPHADNGLRVLFATEEEAKERVVLSVWPRRNDYRPQDLATAAARLRRFLSEGAR